MANYTITIKASDLSGGMESPVAGDTKVSDTEKSKAPLTRGDAAKVAVATVAYQTVKSFATQIINHEVSLVELRTGSNELQQRADFALQIGQKVIGFGASVAAGAMTGAQFGPWGAAAGAIISGTISITQEVFSYSQKIDTLNMKKSLEDVSLQMMNTRAGGSRRYE